jgi:putative DNA primase/helicase
LNPLRDAYWASLIRHFQRSKNCAFGHHGSVSIDLEKGVYHDFESGLGGGVLGLIRHKLGHDEVAAVQWLKINGFTVPLDNTRPQIVAEYDYVDEYGELLFQVVRLEPKSFRQRRPDGHSGWKWDLNGTRRVPYRLPELIEAIASEYLVVIVEGEKDVEVLRNDRIGLDATCCPGGACKWRPEYNEHFRGATVAIIPDNDSTGRAHAAQVAQALQGIAESVAVLDLARHWQECPPHGDISDWLTAGGTREQLDTLIERAQSAAEWIAKYQATTPKANGNAHDDDHEHVSDQDANVKRVVIKCASEIDLEPVEWLWPGRLAIGKTTLIGGDPGLGKSQLSSFIAAALSTGGRWPCDEGVAPEKNIIILSAEDGAADTIVPRLVAAGADKFKIHIVTAVQDVGADGRRLFNLSKDLDVLEREIKRIGNVGLVSIDPVDAYVGSVDSHKNAAVRAVLEPLSEMADRLRTAILAITHFSKQPGGKAIYRFIGSIAHVGSARIAFTVVADADTPA